MDRIAELERAMRQLDQHVRELRAIQLALLVRVADLENAPARDAAQTEVDLVVADASWRAAAQGMKPIDSSTRRPSS
jgi:hypothetical protein